jgi:anti-sigma B factor antagonist
MLRPIAATGDSAFAAYCERRGPAVIVVAQGELDLESADRLRAVLAQPEARGDTVVLDLRRVTFIDSSGLSVIVGQTHQAAEHQFRFAVAVGGAPAVSRLFELTGLDDRVTLIDQPDSILQ